MILAEKFKRLVRRRCPFMDEGGDSLLPCRHAVLMIPAGTDATRANGAAAMWGRAYIMPTCA
jgi:hypothetical protein